MSSDKPASAFEKDLNELETIVETMEKGSLSLEESLSAFEKGVRLVQNCRKTLEKAEQRVKRVSEIDSDEGTDCTPNIQE